MFQKRLFYITLSLLLALELKYPSSSKVNLRR